MNSETSQTPFPTSTGMGDSTSSGGTGADTTVRRVAQKAHETVDRLEQSIGTGQEKMMGWQQEYGDMAREQVRASPLAAIGVAFAVGIIFSKLFMR